MLDESFHAFYKHKPCFYTYTSVCYQFLQLGYFGSRHDIGDVRWLILTLENINNTAMLVPIPAYHPSILSAYYSLVYLYRISHQHDSSVVVLGPAGGAVGVHL